MIHLIINPIAGRGKGVQVAEKAVAVLDEKHVDYKLHYTEYRKHATEIAYDLTTSGEDVIVSCGGDGTIHEVVNGIIKARLELEAAGKPFVTNLALLPCGTGNDFMRSADMSIDPDEALTIVLTGKASPIDAINVSGIYEICFACRGIDIEVVKLVNASKRKTELSYLKKILVCIFKRVNFDFRLDIEGKIINVNAVYAAVLNGSKLASGMNVCTEAKVDDGYLDVVIIKQQSIIKNLISLSKLAGMNFLQDKGVMHFKAKRAIIDVDQDSIDIDGELFDKKEFDAVIAPNIINLIR